MRSFRASSTEWKNETRNALEESQGKIYKCKNMEGRASVTVDGTGALQGQGKEITRLLRGKPPLPPVERGPNGWWLHCPS